VFRPRHPSSRHSFFASVARAKASLPRRSRSGQVVPLRIPRVFALIRLLVLSRLCLPLVNSRVPLSFSSAVGWELGGLHAHLKLAAVFWPARTGTTRTGLLFSTSAGVAALGCGVAVRVRPWSLEATCYVVRVAEPCLMPARSAATRSPSTTATR